MKPLEKFCFALFVAVCLAFIVAALCAVEIIASNELRLDQ